jgi:hypothetical protein
MTHELLGFPGESSRRYIDAYDVTTTILKDRIMDSEIKDRAETIQQQIVNLRDSL